MRTRVRMWWVVKWGGAALTVLITALWVGSCFADIRYHAEDRAFYLRPGCVIEIQLPDGVRVFAATWVFALQRPRWPVAWWFDLYPAFRVVPLWPFVAGALIPTMAVWFLDASARRRAQLNQCVRCGYDRAGLAEGAACPECGGKA